jgi:hypothetical protein
VTVALGAFHQGVDDCGALAGGLAAHEQPALFADGNASDPVFNPVMPRPKLCRVAA